MRPGPPGYGEHNAKGRKVPNKAELEVTDRIKDQHRQELSATRIAQLMPSLGLPTKKGGKWHAKTILKILRQFAKQTGQEQN
ncbi:MAG: recombinase family protein [Bdellovibrionales bacterium]|nr:recombinase family protein [Bdellovibrionales bacterium]